MARRERDKYLKQLGDLPLTRKRSQSTRRWAASPYEMDLLEDAPQHFILTCGCKSQAYRTLMDKGPSFERAYSSEIAVVVVALLKHFGPCTLDQMFEDANNDVPFQNAIHHELRRY